MTFHKRLHTHRTLEAVQVQPTEKAAISAAFVEPSDGLEPSTPSLPSGFVCAVPWSDADSYVSAVAARSAW